MHIKSTTVASKPNNICLRRLSYGSVIIDLLGISILSQLIINPLCKNIDKVYVEICSDLPEAISKYFTFLKIKVLLIFLLSKS